MPANARSRNMAAKRTKLPIPNVYQLKITLLHTEPPIWRRVLIEPFTSLGDLHSIIQVVMQWENKHLHQFRVGKAIYGDPEMDDFELGIRDECGIDVESLYKRRIRTFTYEYDFGDDWEHQIKIEKSLPLNEPILLPYCIDGEGSCPPEDSGGPWGFADKLDILKDPKSEDYDDVRAWMGDFDPTEFSIDLTNECLHSSIFADPDMELLEVFQTTCGWCDSEILEEDEHIAHFVRFDEDFDLEASEGKVVAVSLTSREIPILCFIPASEVRQDSHEGAFHLCSRKCQTALARALEKELVTSRKKTSTKQRHGSP